MDAKQEVETVDPIRNELELASDQSSVEILVCPNCLGAAQCQENAGELVQNYEYGSWNYQIRTSSALQAVAGSRRL